MGGGSVYITRGELSVFSGCSYSEGMGVHSNFLQEWRQVGHVFKVKFSSVILHNKLSDSSFIIIFHSCVNSHVKQIRLEVVAARIS